VLADDHDRAAVVGEHGRGDGQELHGQEERARDVAELLVLARRAHVEDDGPERQQALGLLRRHALVGPGTAVYSDGKRGHDGTRIRPGRKGASARDHVGGARGVR
jgi:hypothetical protein